jgi:hypothetical protein
MALLEAADKQWSALKQGTDVVDDLLEQLK